MAHSNSKRSLTHNAFTHRTLWTINLHCVEWEWRKSAEGINGTYHSVYEAFTYSFMIAENRKKYFWNESFWPMSSLSPPTRTPDYKNVRELDIPPHPHEKRHHTQHTYEKVEKEKHNDILWRGCQAPPSSALCIFHPNAHGTWNWTRLVVFFTISSIIFFLYIVGVCRRAVRWCANNMVNVEKHLPFSFSFSSYSSSCSLFCMSFCFVIRPLIVGLNVYSSGYVCVAARPFIFSHFHSLPPFKRLWKIRKMKMKKDGSRIVD